MYCNTQRQRWESRICAYRVEEVLDRTAGEMVTGHIHHMAWARSRHRMEEVHSWVALVNLQDMKVFPFSKCE